MSVVLHGYEFSAYNRIARMALIEKGVAYSRVEVNPFDDNAPEEYLALHPFKRVPVLAHDDFILYETSAITRYIDEAFDGPSLQPAEARERARMQQIVSIIDSYGYWPMVRQVFSQRVFNAHLGHKPDEAQVSAGLAASARVLTALEKIADEGDVLVAQRMSLADIHLAPMIAYFTAAPEGLAALAQCPILQNWWNFWRRRESVIATDPGLPL